MRNLLKNGAFMMLLSTLFYSLMALFAKIAASEFHSSQITFFRFFLTFLLISFLFLIKRIDFKLVNKKVLVLRGIFGGIAIILYFASFSYIPLGRATLLTYTYPISATILSYFFLKERVKKGAVYALITSIIGLVIITGFDVRQFLLGDILGLLSGIFAGFAVMFIRKSRETDSSWVILYSLGVFGSLMIAPMAVVNFKMPSLNLWVILLLMSLFSIVGQMAMTYAYKFCKASTGSIISLTTVVLANLWGVLFLKEVIGTNLLIGGILVLGSTVYMMDVKKVGKFRVINC